MDVNKLTKKYAGSVSVIVVAAFCLTTSTGHAQTPAQDNARVEASQKALEEAKEAVKSYTTLLRADMSAGKIEAAQQDMVNLAAAKQAVVAAEEKLNADLQQLGKDSARFNGAPADNAAAPAAQPAATGTIPGTSITPAPLPVPATPTATGTIPGTAITPSRAPIPATPVTPAGTTATPAPAATAGQK